MLFIVVAALLGLLAVFALVLAKGFVWGLTFWLGISLGLLILGWLVITFIKPRYGFWWSQVVCDSEFRQGSETVESYFHTPRYKTESEKRSNCSLQKDGLMIVQSQT